MQGLRLQLQPPVAGDLPGVDKPTVAMAVDSGGRFYFKNQIVTNEMQLSNNLRQAVTGAREPLTLVIHADKSVTEDRLIHRRCSPGPPAFKARCSPRCRVPPVRPPGHE